MAKSKFDVHLRVTIDTDDPSLRRVKAAFIRELHDMAYQGCTTIFSGGDLEYEGCLAKVRSTRRAKC